MTGFVPLAACSLSKWLSGDWHYCIFDPLVSQIGEPLFGLIVGGVTVFALYLAGGGDLATPSTVTILFGAVMVPVLPGGMVGVAYFIGVAGLVGAVLGIAQKYILAPGVR